MQALQTLDTHCVDEGNPACGRMTAEWGAPLYQSLQPLLATGVVRVPGAVQAHAAPGRPGMPMRLGAACASSLPACSSTPVHTHPRLCFLLLLKHK